MGGNRPAAASSGAGRDSHPINWFQASAPPQCPPWRHRQAANGCLLQRTIPPLQAPQRFHHCRRQTSHQKAARWWCRGYACAHGLVLPVQWVRRCGRGCSFEDRRLGGFERKMNTWRIRVSDEEEDQSEEGYRGWAGGVRSWLEGLGHGRYASLFEIHEVDDEVLLLLTMEDLKDMGINAVGSRRKMFCRIEKLRKNKGS
ncbi:hypothetical protein AXF42_Ash003912 [Apostasia shenzhenica]|uniref:SAM domain-containing protein n=1 Tax=Apostasia shenzhenica TaxID=1088818 RepID=A0A2I0AIC0_9ASPA|nr:hypothetical protein AXF42_Ash003912 [Apostasia shenzhenica]